jgi:hypothetical protein
MASIADKIKTLKAILDSYVTDLQNITENIEKLKQNHTQDLYEKDQELKEFERKLLECQREKDTIQQQLDDRVRELENSDLPNSEKQRRITNLLLNNRDNLDNICQTTLKIWTNYEKSRDSILAALRKDSERQLRRVENLNTKKRVLLGVVILLIIVNLTLFYFYHKLKKKFREK